MNVHSAPALALAAAFTAAALASGCGSSAPVTYSAPVGISVEPNGSSNSYPVASVPGPTGTGPVQMTVAFDSATTTAPDYADLVGGAFKVVLTGPAATGFSTKGATADLTATLTFVAYP